MDHKFFFNSQATGGQAPFCSAPRLTKPRLAKKKYTAANRPICVENDPSYNPFRSQPMRDSSSVVNDGHLGSNNTSISGNVGVAIGTSKAEIYGKAFSSTFTSDPFCTAGHANFRGIVGDEALLGDMRKLKIDSDQHHINVSTDMNANETRKSDMRGTDQVLASMLTEEVESKLKIESEGIAESAQKGDSLKFKSSGSTKLHDSFAIGENVGGCAGRMNVLNEMNKLNIKDEATDKLKNPAYGRVEFLGRISGESHPDLQKTIHLKETMNPHLGTGNINFSFHSNGIYKPKCRGPSDGVHTALPATKTANEMKTEFSCGKSSIFSGAVPSEITFQAERREVSTNRKVHVGDESSTTTSCSSNNVQCASGGLEAPVIYMPGKKVEFSFSEMMQHVDFNTPNLKGSLNRKFETKRDLTKDTKLKKKKGKHRKPVSTSMHVGQGYSPVESLQENADSSESCSPMDISPYQETNADNSFSRETSVTSDEASSANDKYASSESHPMVVNDIADDHLIDATQRLSINEKNVKFNEKEEVESMHFHPAVSAERPSEGSFSGAETESFKSATDQLDCSSDSFFTAVDNEVSSSSTIERQYIIGGTQTNLDDTCQSSFTFAASSTAQCHSPPVARNQKKKVQSRRGTDLSSSLSGAKVSISSFTLNHFQVPGTSSSSFNKAKNFDLPSDSNHVSNQCHGKSEPVKKSEVKQETRFPTVESMAAQEACENWRVRGNQAYASGDLSRAEHYYTQGINCISQIEISRSVHQALMLCYSNRAATRMSLGRMKEALVDCLTAIKMDPNFFRAQIRAANCYLSLGETESASQHFMRCLEIGSKSCVESKVLAEASEGLKKTQKVSECMKQSMTLLGRRTHDDVVGALTLIADALMISPCSEKLLEMKVDALFMLRKYEEVIQLCALTRPSAELKTYGSDADLGMLGASKKPKTASFRLWCCSMTVKAYFYLGKLEEAANFLNKEEKSMPLKESGGDFTLDSSIPLAATIRELLRFKALGNEAFKSGKPVDAIDLYSAAISCNVESRPFSAICFCNRAAAYRAVGQILDAIADCNLSIALDGNYVKAISRRASLLEMIRDFGQAASDLQRLISLLTRQMENKANHSDKSSLVNEIRQTQQKLLRMENEDKNEIPLNMYLILGVDPSAASSDIKKAYRKAALKHHPDKAGQLVNKHDNADDGTWREIGEEVRRDADRLFKMIGEAYALLSDPAKRARYDLEEEIRNGQSIRGNRGGTMKTQMESQNYPFERSGSRWQRSDVWRAYGKSQPRDSDTSHQSNWYS
ncbi:unnamed protein product [Cuscuta campestris]|uniref:J domain-containing protein n=1 Tax=Cuscuta campestris TaxID=132261 RepID=A0A484N2J6_9ASTE|nr:unnamed protein product [Cuscuta campestris]